MDDIVKLKKFADKNKLPVVLCIFWIVVANLLYFSVDTVSCLTMGVQTSNTNWVNIWNELTLGYVSLYEAIRHTYNPELNISAWQIANSGPCRAGFSWSGYAAFMLIPIVSIWSVSYSIKWVKKQ